MAGVIHSFIAVMVLAAAQQGPAKPAETPTAAPKSDQTGVESFFAEFAKKRDGITGLTAQFHQENVTADEPNPTPTSGTITYAKPRRIVFRYNDPAEVFLIDDHRVYHYVAQIQQVQIYDLQNDPKSEALFLGFDQDAKRLQKAYHVAVTAPEKPEQGSKGLELVPETKDSASNTEEGAPLFNKVRLTLRDSDYLPTYIHVINDDQSEVRTSVSDIKIQAAVDSSLTQLDLPEGTTIVENEKIVETVGPGGKRIPEPAKSSGAAQSATPAEPAKPAQPPAATPPAKPTSPEPDTKKP